MSTQRLAFGLLYVIDECVGGAESQGGRVFNMGIYILDFSIYRDILHCLIVTD